VQCVVIDDGSDDDTAWIAREAGATVVSQPPSGLGAAVRSGFAAAVALDPAAVAFCDADGEYAPEELELLVKPILRGEADYVVGSRFAGDIQRMLPHRRFGNHVLTRALARIARTPITDGQSGYRAFSPAAAREAEVIHDYNYAQVLTLDLLGKGFGYVEVPIRYAFREKGRSFVKLVPYLAHVVPAVWRQRRRSRLILDNVTREPRSRRIPSPPVDRRS
jgi:glycosyltransferase involved in cell wall biosynthesis